ncbi:hypothetical protein GYMLUDRAFT_955087 [Collybiopsis luxurians FD-317 M1]|nr:hypothetical protein GYMLUDRAFT_955087 [Collybiopsis luxurians FD-317 M1]
MKYQEIYLDAHPPLAERALIPATIRALLPENSLSISSLIEFPILVSTRAVIPPLSNDSELFSPISSSIDSADAVTLLSVLDIPSPGDLIELRSKAHQALDLNLQFCEVTWSCDRFGTIRNRF